MSMTAGPQARTYYEGPQAITADAQVHRRYFTYRTETGIVAGSDVSVMFAIDSPVALVWPCFKDFNLGQNPHRHYYSGVVGDLEGKTFGLSNQPEEASMLHRYHVQRVVPEHLIIVTQHDPGPGLHVFMLNEHGGRTIVTVLMEHASHPQDVSEDEALGPWRDEKTVAELQRKWPEYFIPTLKKLIREGNQH
jgi:hypothetical protein